jgi:voltage-gated potassium channel
VSPLARNQDAYDRFAAAVELPLTVLSALWLVVLIVPLVASVPTDVRDTFIFIDFAVWACFIFEYVVKLFLAPNRWSFFKRHVLELLVIVVPFFRPLRAARLVVLLRGSVLITNVVRRSRDLATHRGFHFVLLGVVCLVFACAGLVLVFERQAHGSTIHNYGQALWWGMSTLTTVGYGDRFPVTPAGQGIAVVLMIAGIGLVGVFTATIASYFMGESQTKAAQERAEIDAKAAQERTEIEARGRAERAEMNDRLKRIEARLDELVGGSLTSNGQEVRQSAEQRTVATSD